MDDDDINYVEEHNKLKTIEKISDKADPIFFLSHLYYQAPERFEISRGDRKKLYQMSSFIRSIEQTKLQTYFEPKKFKMDYSQLAYISNLNGWVFGKQAPVKSDKSCN